MDTFCPVGRLLALTETVMTTESDPIMKHLFLIPLFLVCIPIEAHAEIYTWTDDQGTVTFTDNPSQIPARYNSSRKCGEIISIQSVKPQEAVRLGRTTKLQAAVPGNRVKSVADARQIALELQAEVEGHPGSDQKDTFIP